MLAPIPTSRSLHNLYGWSDIHVLLPHRHRWAWIRRWKECAVSYWHFAGDIDTMQYDHSWASLLSYRGRDTFWTTKI